MANIRKIARRSFLIGSAAIVGGVAFGVYKINEDAPNPLITAEGESTLNPFILINADGVTIITPRAEMGQGVQTTLAALVAEELDVAWEDINVMHGPPAQAYYNSALLGSALPFKHYEDTDFKHGLRQSVGKVGKLLSLQVTGGSTSMKDGFERMRHAGASAREALKIVGAQRLGMDAKDVTTKDGYVHGIDGQKLSYIELAEDAAKIKAPAPELRPSSEWKYLGKSMPRKDMLGKSTGTAAYAIDTILPDMKFATVRMNPKRSGMISYDDSAALKMAGVDKIVDLGTGIGVIASNTWLAFKAAEAVNIVWEDASYPAHSEVLMDAIKASLDDKPNSTARDDGDVTAAVEGTEITAEYTVPWLAHTTMEPMNATALLKDGHLTVWSGNQAPIIARDKCAEATGLTPDDVTVHTTLMGGGFGRRSESDFSVQAARLAAAMPDAPIKMTWTREEDMTQDFYRPAAAARFRGVVKDGAAVLLDGAIAAPSVTKQSILRVTGNTAPGPDRAHVEAAADQPYAIPNQRITGHLTDIEVPIGSWRSVASSFNGFFYDTFIDELAHAANADPLEFRLAMAKAEHEPSALAIKKVKEMSGWTGQTPDGIGRGIGFSYTFGTAVAMVVEVAQKGRAIGIKMVWIACDVGTALDPSIIEAQMISGAIYGMSAAIQGEINFEEGAAQEQNFPDYDALRMHNTPLFEVAILENAPHLGGVGEPGTPPSMPALGNALFDLTGIRARDLPFIKTYDLVL